jgi:hypothetical protein
MIGLTVSAAAQNIPQGYVIPECTLSPDGRFGVTVPRRKRTKEMFVRATMKPKRRIASKAESLLSPGAQQSTKRKAFSSA